MSASWTGFTQFTLLEGKPQDGYMWSGVRLTRKQLTTRPDHLWPELWKSMGKHAKLKEKQKWSEENLLPELWTKVGRNAELKEKQICSNEKPQLDNARRLRGIFFSDPEDTEFKETIKNARKKLETPMASAMPCKTCKKNKHGKTRSKTNDFKSKCVWPERWGHQGMSITGGGGLVSFQNLRVCKHHLDLGVAHAGREG